MSLTKDGVRLSASAVGSVWGARLYEVELFGRKESLSFRQHFWSQKSIIYVDVLKEEVMRFLLSLSFLFLCCVVFADGLKEESLKLTEEGKRLLEKNNVDGALKKFMEAIEADIMNADAHRFYQDIQRERGAHKELLKLYGEFLEKKPDSALFNYLYGRLQTDLKEERKFYEKAVELEPNFYWGHFGLAYVHFTEKDLDSAKAEYRKCIEIDPKRPEGYYHLAKVQRELSEFEEALKTYAKMAELLPGDPTPLVESGRTEAERGRSAAAVEFFEKAMRIRNLDGDVSFLLDYAKALTGAGRKKDAVGVYKKTLHLPLESEVYSQLADVCRRLFVKPLPEYLRDDFIEVVKKLESGECEAAIEKLLALRKESPDEVYLLHALGEAHRRSGDTDGAIKYLKEALKKNADFADAHLLLGSIYAESGDVKSALSHLSSAVELNPFDPIATSLYLKLLFGSGKYKDAWNLAFYYWRLSDDLKGAQKVAMSAELNIDEVGEVEKEFKHKDFTVRLYEGWEQILPGYRFVWHFKVFDGDGKLKRKGFVIMLDEHTETEGKVKRVYRMNEVSFAEDEPPLKEVKVFDSEPSLDEVTESIKKLLDGK